MKAYQAWMILQDYTSDDEEWHEAAKVVARFLYEDRRFAWIRRKAAGGATIDSLYADAMLDTWEKVQRDMSEQYVALASDNAASQEDDASAEAGRESAQGVFGSYQHVASDDDLAGILVKSIVRRFVTLVKRRRRFEDEKDDAVEEAKAQVEWEAENERNMQTADRFKKMANEMALQEVAPTYQNCGQQCLDYLKSPKRKRKTRDSVIEKIEQMTKADSLLLSGDFSYDEMLEEMGIDPTDNTARNTFQQQVSRARTKLREWADTPEGQREEVELGDHKMALSVFLDRIFSFLQDQRLFRHDSSPGDYANDE